MSLFAGNCRCDRFAKTFRRGGVGLQFYLLDIAPDLFTENGVPRRNDDRYIAAGLRLAGEPDEGLGIGGLLVPEDLHLTAFTRADLGQLFLAAENTDPARSARSGGALDGNGTFPAAVVLLLPIL